MNVDLIFRIAGIGVLVSVLGQVLTRTGREDMAMLTTLAGLVVVLLMVVGLISQLFQSVRSIFSL
ncbi:MAG: stage III sporulation protein AC [Firmicutes bacterium]|nr:stage III sporulation protein AC [Bacillota bacterium]